MKPGSTHRLQRERPVTRHQVLLALMRAGLNLAEARALGMEEMLCLLIHQQLEDSLAALDAEAARVASIPLADSGEQQRLLNALNHRVETELDRFYKKQYANTGRSDIGGVDVWDKR